MDGTILIVGAGAFGVSTAWHLSQSHTDPSQVTLIDREPASATPRAAAATDMNRILTADYPASPLYARVAREALAFWAEDPDLEWYFHQVGRLVLRGGGEGEGGGRGRGEEASHQDKVVALDEIGRRWEALQQQRGATDVRSLGGGGGAYLDAGAGWVDAATATWQFLETAVRRRVRRAVGEVVALLVVDGRIKGARTAEGRAFWAETVVLATGAWTSALLAPVEDALGVNGEDGEGDRVEGQARATALVSAAYPVSREETRRMAGAKMPVVVYGDVGEVVPASAENKMLRYNLSKTRIVNTVTTESGRRISAPPTTRAQHDVPRQIKTELQAALSSKLVPEFATAEPTWRMCWDNCSPTGDLLLCEHPRLKSCFIITGGSFNGYKFMPNIGKYMVNVLKGQSNGREMDKAWGWKSKAEREAAADGHVERSRELNDLMGADSGSKL